MKKEIIKLINMSLENPRTIDEVKEFVFNIVYSKYKVLECSLEKESDKLYSILSNEKTTYPLNGNNNDEIIIKLEKYKKYYMDIILIQEGFIEKYLYEHPHKNLIVDYEVEDEPTEKPTFEAYTFRGTLGDPSVIEIPNSDTRLTLSVTGKSNGHVIVSLSRTTMDEKFISMYMRNYKCSEIDVIKFDIDDGDYRYILSIDIEDIKLGNPYIIKVIEK